MTVLLLVSSDQYWYSEQLPEFDAQTLKSILSAKSKRLQAAVAQVDLIAKQLAPNIYFHSQERFLASDPMDFISQSELVHWKSFPGFSFLAQQRYVEIPKGQIDPQLLATKYGRSIFRPYELSGLEAGREGYYLNLVSPPQVNLEKAPILWRLSHHPDLKNLQDFSDPNSVILLIEYWYHADHNPISIYFGSHQGDWESFAFLIKISTESNPQLLATYLSAHQDGQWYCSTDLEKGEDGRIDLYSSLGSHATYAHSGTGNLGILPDYTEKSILWKSGTHLRALINEPYYGFTGAWGAAYFHWGMTGPMPPAPRYKYLPRENIDAEGLRQKCRFR